MKSFLYQPQHIHVSTRGRFLRDAVFLHLKQTTLLGLLQNSENLSPVAILRCVGGRGSSYVLLSSLFKCS